MHECPVRNDKKAKPFNSIGFVNEKLIKSNEITLKIFTFSLPLILKFLQLPSIYFAANYKFH